MNPLTRYKYPIALLVGIICVAGSIYLTRVYFDHKEQQLRQQIRAQRQLTDVVVAKRDLAIGEQVNLETMEIKSIPFEYIPDGAVTPDQYATVEFKRLRDPVSAGKPLLRQFVEGVSRIERFSDLLAPGERAITLEVDGVTSIEHMIESGDQLDLAVRKNNSRELELLLERVKVLSTGKFTTADPKVPGMYKSIQYPTLTLGVPSESVRDIFEAEDNGDLVFLLRNRNDNLAARYELSNSEQNQVEIYSAAQASDGVLSTKIEKVPESSLEPAEAPYLRNAKGRIVRISNLLALSESDKSGTNDEVRAEDE